MREQQQPQMSSPDINQSLPAQDASGPAMSPAGVAQEEQGNQALTDQMCGNEEELPEDLQAFLSHGVFGPESMIAPTNIGGFDAEFDPATGQLLVTVVASMNFVDGLTLAGGTFTAGHAQLNDAAADGNLLATQEEKEAFLEQFVWGDAEKTQWLADLEANVQALWSNRYSFSVDREGWECVQASVLVDIDIMEANRPDTHVHCTSYKVPEDGSYDVGASVLTTDRDPHDNEMRLSSRDVLSPEDAAEASLLRREIYFDEDSADLNQAATRRLDSVSADFDDANSDLTNPIELVGRASLGGSRRHNQALSEERAQVVSEYLQNNEGVSAKRITARGAGEEGATEDAEWQRVDLIVDGAAGQDVAAHEFGHVLGLGDEYVDSKDHYPDGTFRGTGLPTGDPSRHDQLAKDIGVTGGAIHENNDRIMSMGSRVEPAHYSTVGWALKQLTGIPEWTIDS
jgi:outer membrane protein OmpA-like peptidoglycan-associated protein